MPMELSTFASVICISMAVTGLMLLLVVPKTDEYRRHIGVSLFSVGMGGTVAFFLLDNPDVLASAREHIALTLIGMIIATLQVIRLIRK